MKIELVVFTSTCEHMEHVHGWSKISVVLSIYWIMEGGNDRASWVLWSISMWLFQGKYKDRNCNRILNGVYVIDCHDHGALDANWGTVY